MINYRLEWITNENEDVDFVYGALSNPEVQRLARGPEYTFVSPETVKAEMEYIPGAWWIIWIDRTQVGWVRLTPLSVFGASLAIVIPDLKYRHQGIGFEICWNVIYEVAFPLFREIYWTTWLYNHASLRLANALGFEPYMVANEKIVLIKRKK